MDRALFTAMTGAKNTMHAQAVHANNLANAATDGFKSDFVLAQAKMVEGEGWNTRHFVTASTAAIDFSSGTQKQTGRDLDVAIDGEGWMTIQEPDGRISYTRSGQLSVNSNGLLVNQSGEIIMGNAGPILIPEAEKIEIGFDGTISLRGVGQSPDTLTQIDRLRLVNPPKEFLTKESDGKIYADESVQVPLDATVRVRKGFLESSNVNTVDELTNIMSLARQFEMQIKVMNAVGEMVDRNAQLIRMQV